MSTTNDSHIEKMAATAAKAQSIVPEEQDFVTQDFLVPVRQDSADTVTFFTRVVNTTSNPVALLFPRDPQRFRASITSIDQDVVLCQSRDLASNAANQATNVPTPTGYYLSKGVTVNIYAKSPCYVAATSSTATRVSVMVEKYEDPES